MNDFKFVSVCFFHGSGGADGVSFLTEREEKTKEEEKKAEDVINDAKGPRFPKEAGGKIQLVKIGDHTKGEQKRGDDSQNRESFAEQAFVEVHRALLYRSFFLRRMETRARVRVRMQKMQSIHLVMALAKNAIASLT